MKDLQKETAPQEKLIDGKRIVSLSRKSSERVEDDRTEDEVFFDWTQDGCPIPEEQAEIPDTCLSLDDMKQINQRAVDEWWSKQ
jgi:hypothetical protein